MIKFLKTYWKTLMFFTVVGLFGGFFTGIYLMDSYPAQIRQELLDQGLNDFLLGAVTAVQSAGYGLVLGALGIWLGKRTGLWRDETVLAKKPLLISIAVSIIGGMALILPDLMVFGPRCPAILDSYAVKPTMAYILAAVSYGAVIEEVMLRLFHMSLIAFLLNKLLGKNRERPATAILVAANILAALLFAAGHLPATFLLLGSSPMILARCFLLNGGAGLAFGWLYRRYGLRYSMIAHGGCHVVSKLIWILFV